MIRTPRWRFPEVRTDLVVSSERVREGSEESRQDTAAFLGLNHRALESQSREFTLSTPVRNAVRRGRRNVRELEDLNLKSEQS